MSKHVEVSGLWVGNRLPILQQLSIRTFLDYGHKYILYVYDNVKNIPEGVEVRNGNDILDETVVPINLFSSLACFSDAFRLHLFAKQPKAFYVDTDHMCISDDIPMLGDYALYTESNGSLFNGTLAYPQTCPVAQYVASYSLNPGYILPWDTPMMKARKIKFAKEHRGETFLYRYFHAWLSLLTGARLLQGLKYFGLEDKLQRECFATDESFVPFRKWRTLFDGTYNLSHFQREGVWGIHAYNEMLRRASFDVLYDTAEDSVMGELFSKHMNGLDSIKPLVTVYYCRHRNWSGDLQFYRDGTFKRNNGDGGHYVMDGDKLELHWDRWDMEYAVKVGKNAYKGSTFVLTPR